MSMSRMGLMLIAAVLALAPAAGAAGEPGWENRVFLAGEKRQTVQATPIELRPYRPLHFYGNTVRRVYYHGRALPTPREFGAGMFALIRVR